MKALAKLIEQSIGKVLDHREFSQWLASELVNQGDIIIINNSFVFRDISTNKSEQYVALRIGKDKVPERHPLIAKGLKINADLKHFSANSQNLPEIVDLNKAIEVEKGQLGSLLFILIGLIDDTVQLEHPIKHSAFNSVIWDPTLAHTAVISGTTIHVKETNDEEAVWAKISDHFFERKEPIPDGLREAVGVTLDKLQDEAVAHLRLPKPSGSLDGGMTDSIVAVLREQRTQYDAAFTKSGGNPTRHPGAFNELLRIAYNFASDATTYLRLIVSICDLKPLVFWGTIGEHFRLSEAFRGLPWARSTGKPSLKNYISTIADSRNSTFHNMFPFRKTLNFELPMSALQQASLKIFSEHGKKKENRLNYRDQELVDVLVEFTRARERQVAPRFWKQNLEVMDATIELFSQTAAFLKILYSKV